MIPYSKQYISSLDIKNVEKVLKSNFLTQGPQVEIFEKKLCEYTGAKYSAAVNSATSGLHLSCIALGIKKNDHVWTVSNTFVSTANCARLCGAIVSFLDIDLDFYLIDLIKLEKCLKNAKKNKKLPKLLITVHLGGQPTFQEKLKSLSKKYHFKIIEDASHSLGASRNKNYVGNCKFSEITVFSFHPVKSITTGEGGAVMTNNKHIINKIKLLRTHGITKNHKDFISKNVTPWHYEQQELGLNYRMNDISAILGITQLNQIRKFIKKRNLLAKNYFNKLNDLPLFLPKILKGNYSSFHLFIIRLDIKKLKITHSSFFTQMRKKGINVNLHYQPVHLQPYYKKNSKKITSLNNTLLYSKSAISIPIYYDLSIKNQNYVIKVIRDLCKKNLK